MKKKRIKRNYNFLYILIGIIIIFIIAISTNNGYINETIKCKEIKGHLCSNYEIEKFIERK